MNIAIVGLGLIGGSFAKSIKARTAHRVWGTDIDHETMTLARLCGAIDAPLEEEKLKDCDLILVALCPAAAITWVQEHSGQISAKTTVVDLCGIKREVCAALTPIAETKGFSFIGGHPMAGSERGGFVNAKDNLFCGAAMILTPLETTDIHLLEDLKRFFTDVGFGSLTFATPEEHDRIIAFTSQLAHITSSAYIKSPEAQRNRGFAAGSYRDMTRVALLDEAMWTELFLANKDFLTEELSLLIENLKEYLAALKEGDAQQLRALLKDGREKKATAGGN
ncbi:MAG TPA: prephenate dehydrogenase [Clostridiales bacterium]|nr:prephenate dehydrogenase [Clostridiales bacterium]